MGNSIVTLHDNSELFGELIEATAEDMKINPLYVEKDYWVTYVLKSLSLSPFVEEAIFKGGTSLSKAYKLIERFSEDVDLAVITNAKSANQIKKLLKEIESSILDRNFTELKKHPKSSKGSQFRKTLHHYQKIKKGDFGEADELIMIEINAFASPHPFAKQEIVSYISEFLETRDESLIAKYKLEPFNINVLDIKRTFCEKLSAIARASYESDYELTELKAKIRHLYDIHFLLEDERIREFIHDSESFKKMIKNVRVDDQNQFSSSWSKVEFHNSEIFQNTKEIMSKIDRYYHDIFSQLVYSDTLPTIDDICESLMLISDKLKEHKL